MAKQTLVTTNQEAKIIDIKGEPHMKLNLTGISLSNFTGPQTTYAKKNQVEVYIPLYVIPYFMRNQREAVAEWEAKQLDVIDRVKKAFNTEVQPKKEQSNS